MAIKILGAALALLAGSLSSYGLTAAEVIARARAYVAGEERLAKLESIHYIGRIEVAGPEGYGGSLEIVLQKPLQQRSRIEIVRSGGEAASAGAQVVISALDDYEGWRQMELAGHPESRRVLLLGKEDLRRMRANTWENLYFFHGIESVGGSYEAAGEQEIGGRPCLKIIFRHLGGLHFVRYFDRETGRLLLTEMESGAQLREVGEMVVEGIRFPRKVITTDSAGRVTTITFESIRINQSFPAEIFSMPVPARAPSRAGPG